MSAQVMPEYWGLLPASLLGDQPSGRRIRSPRDWIADVFLFLLAVAFTVLTIVDGREHHAEIAPEAVMGALACAGVWVRRRWPVPFAIATCLLSVYSMAAAGVALIALFTVAVHRRLAVVAGVTALSAGASAVAVAVRPDLPSANGFQVVIGLVILAAVLGWGMFARARRQLVLALRERALRAEAEQDFRAAQARVLERQRIAREMHDVVAHRMSLLSLYAGALEVNADASKQEVAEAAKVIGAAAHQALEELRQVIGVLRADVAGQAQQHPQPTAADLPALIGEARDAGMIVEVDWKIANIANVPVYAGRDGYRIMQEGLTNARKHAPGAPVTVEVSGAPGMGLTIEIRNPLGTNGSGFGLIGLTERVTIAGGRLESGVTQEGGFRLWAWLPWHT